MEYTFNLKLYLLGHVGSVTSGLIIGKRLSRLNEVSQGNEPGVGEVFRVFNAVLLDIL